MPSIKVAVAGATGNAGIPIINELLKANYAVTALTRAGGTNSTRLPQHANLRIATIDHDSVSSMADALQGHKAVIASLPTAAPIGSQDRLIDVCVAAGVTRFFP